MTTSERTAEDAEGERSPSPLRHLSGSSSFLKLEELGRYGLITNGEPDLSQEPTLRCVLPASAPEAERWLKLRLTCRLSFWVAAGVLEAVKGFRRLKGHKAMPQLVAALRARDQQLGPRRFCMRGSPQATAYWRAVTPCLGDISSRRASA